MAVGRQPATEGGKLEQEFGDDDGRPVDVEALDDLGEILGAESVDQLEERGVGAGGIRVEQMHHDHRTGGALQCGEGADPVFGNGLEQLVASQEFFVGQLIPVDSLV